MEGFMMRGLDPIVPVCRWLHEPQPISYQPMWSGFPHRAGRCRPGGSRYLSPVGRSCNEKEGFTIWGGYPILPGVWWNLDGSIQHQSSRKIQRPLTWIWSADQLPIL